MHLHPDRLLPAAEPELSIARDLYDSIATLPIISPHGHVVPQWLADNTPFSDPATLFLTPDHYVLRMLRSRGLSYDQFAVPRNDGKPVAAGRDAWRLFAKNYYLFAATPSKTWIDHSLSFMFGIDKPLGPDTADEIYDTIDAALKTPELLPLAILDKANVELLGTTEFALDELPHHKKLKSQGLIGRIRTTYRPDDVTDPDKPGFAERIAQFGEITGENTATFAGLLNAHRTRRAFFRENGGAVATDHGVPTGLTADLSTPEKQKLLDDALAGKLDAAGAELFRAQMLTEMAGLSVEDGMVMQIHAGSKRNTDPLLFAERGPDKGADIPTGANYVHDLAPLLGKYGNEPNLHIILFTLDEDLYSREMAPMAGYWPSLMIGPPWWFHDSPEGIRRYLDRVHESGGFYNLAGFNDDTRALLSIPARHDVWRREVARFLSRLVGERRISRDTAAELAKHLAYQAAKDAYRV